MKKDTLTDLKLKEKNREDKFFKKLDCKLIRINPDKENFDIFIEIGKIIIYFSESNKTIN